jgi:hypothetical protein
MIDVRLMIKDGELLVWILPDKVKRPVCLVSSCEVIEMDPMPADCAAWINILEKK